jgi:3-phosphoshikimate 1-carboxyvinyltransferase
MSRAIITAAKAPLRGIIRLPGDKSISHRRALLSLFVREDVQLTNYGTGEDCAITLRCLERLGKTVRQSGHAVHISGLAGCRSAELNCGNSGTTARLLMGILAGHEGEWALTGDVSLSRRPMERVVGPLRSMGAKIELSDGHLPARIVGQSLKGIDYESPIASAQVKSAVLLAGLKAQGATRYREIIMTRDHTERLLGVGVDYVEWITVNREHVALDGASLSGEIPGDPSTASFWLTAAELIPGSHIEMPNILANPLRIGMVKLLREHGGQIHLGDVRESGSEGVATMSIATSALTPFVLRQPETAKLMDEIPALAVLATQTTGRCEFHDADELRVKESDRLALITNDLQRMNVPVNTWENGFAVIGPCSLSGTAIRTDGDHRIAMAFAVAGLAATGETVIEEADCVGVSYPEFWTVLAQLAPSSVRLA